MGVGEQDHGRVAMPIAAMLACAVHQPLDLAFGEIAPLDCQVYDGWCAFLGPGTLADITNWSPRIWKSGALSMNFDSRAQVIVATNCWSRFHRRQRGRCPHSAEGDMWAERGVRFDVVDGAHSAASRCHRVVASKRPPQRLPVVAHGNRASIQTPKISSAISRRGTTHSEGSHGNSRIAPTTDSLAGAPISPASPSPERGEPTLHCLGVG